jgi:hypothetical protein
MTDRWVRRYDQYSLRDDFLACDSEEFATKCLIVGKLHARGTFLHSRSREISESSSKQALRLGLKMTCCRTAFRCPLSSLSLYPHWPLSF